MDENQVQETNLEQEMETNQTVEVQVEQVENTTTQQTEQVDDVPKFATMEEYKKHIQSIQSKAKGELLKEIGFEKVADIKQAIAEGQSLKQIAEEYDLTKKEVEELKLQLQERDNKLLQVENERLLQELNIPNQYADKFIQLVDNDKSELPRKDKAIAVKQMLLSIAGHVQNFGNDKQQHINHEEEDKKLIKSLQKL